MHICRPKISDVRRRKALCPTCGGIRVMIEWFEEWYGWNSTCIRCGEQWQDAEPVERPFAPRWRQKNIRAALDLWWAWVQLQHQRVTDGR